MENYSNQDSFPEIVHNVANLSNTVLIDKKSNRTRFKSPYRDAIMRLMFQALDAYEQCERKGETSVTIHSPFHPLTSTTSISMPIGHRGAGSGAVSAPFVTYIPEEHTQAELFRDVRFWKPYSKVLPNLRMNHRPAPWRDLSDVGRIEWFHHALRLSGPYADFTLRLSHKIEQKVRAHPNSVKWLASRISYRLKEAFDTPVDFWFVLEISDKNHIHLHGEIGISEESFSIARKALRIAGGEWETTRQHQAQIRKFPSSIWSNYCLKNHSYMRKHSPRIAQMMQRPINGNWFFATDNVRRNSKLLYEDRRRRAVQLWNSGNLITTPAFHILSDK